MRKVIMKIQESKTKMLSSQDVKWGINLMPKLEKITLAPRRYVDWMGKYKSAWVELERCER